MRRLRTRRPENRLQLIRVLLNDQFLKSVRVREYGFLRLVDIEIIRRHHHGYGQERGQEQSGDEVA